MSDKKYILAFDTANESIAIGIGEIIENDIKLVGSYEGKAHRASNTSLLPEIEKLTNKKSINKNELAYIISGRGPGSFTGVRISLATAKGISTALSIPLVGINTLDAVAWRTWKDGIRGHIYVVADAMRNEIYPALYESTENGIKRLSPNKVLKANVCAEEAIEFSRKVDNLTITGDALIKYFDLFETLNIANQELWVPNGWSLLQASKFEDKSKPGEVLPVYTRLSDAEESERESNFKASATDKNLITGVQNLHKQNSNFLFEPLSFEYIKQVEKLEKQLMGSDFWNSNKIESDLSLKNRSWWIAKFDNKIIGYCGAMQSDNKMELLKIAVDEEYQNKGLAKKLISLVANDMRNLGAQSVILEVRATNTKAINFYKSLNIQIISTREKYYSDKEDALIMEGPLPIINEDVAGMNLNTNANVIKNSSDLKKPVIFSVESSCDETACAITFDEDIVSDVVASQVDFHKRFGGVVPEIASRKHIEAICGVADTCIEKAGISWKDLDAVSATYAPGLVGALVVGMAFAKGISFALDIPFIGVNHLEGHIYANKLAENNFEMPAIASIISGGNTMLVHIKNWGDYVTLGTTIDDAVGEAFDKLSKYLGLGYPGGPIISKLAKNGDPKSINFPRALINSKDYNFSLSGLKTAVINYIEEHKDEKNFNLENLCASFEQAVIDVQVFKARSAIKEKSAKSFLFGGGVAANPELREAYQQMCDEEKIKMVMAPLSACGDNAAMVGLVAADRYKNQNFFELNSDVSAHASLDEKY